MTPHEITRIVRSAGFDPLAPPLREGSTYVLRATDFRGILMRVVVDAHSGAIRAVNRIVAGPSPIGPIGMMPPPYGGDAALRIGGLRRPRDGAGRTERARGLAAGGARRRSPGGIPAAAAAAAGGACLPQSRH